MEKEVKIRGLLIDPTTSSPVVLLKELQGDAVLPIWVGPFEANSIAAEIEKRSTQRPMTHDLIKNILDQMGAIAERITITALMESTFYALIQIRTIENQMLVIDARPSDAIALALRCDCPIFIKDEIFDLPAADGVELSRECVSTGEEIDWPNELQ